MRCQKACSYLPAYCNNELTGSQQIELSEHLASCPDCRRTESMFQAIRQGAATVAPSKVSSDFNARLLERVAQERFAETRTVAHLPRTSPRLFQRWFVPAFATAALALAFGINMAPKLAVFNHEDVVPTASLAANDSYLTAQPVSNPNVTASLGKDWSLNSHLARSERYNRLSTSVAPTWASFASSNPVQNSDFASRVPYDFTSFQTRRIVVQYISPNGAVLTIGGVGTY